MLVLSRLVGEAIVFDGPGRLIISSVQGDKVRIAFEAPRSTSIDREEVAISKAKSRALSQGDAQT